MKWIASLLFAASLGLAASPGLAAPYEAKIVLTPEKTPVRIDRNIYGQFVEHLGRGVYEGIWVGEDSSIPNVRGIRSDVVAALRKIKVPLVRCRAAASLRYIIGGTAWDRPLSALSG